MESSNTFQKMDLGRWIIQIRDSLEREEGDVEGKESRVSVFNVPKELLAAKPEAYIPQCVSIGPYHRWRSELCEMERYKVVAARRFQKRINGNRFESVVEEVRKHERQIRSCYHKFLDYNGEALAWLMALDASFVLECLQFYVKHGDQTCSEVSTEVKQLGKVLDPSGRSATHNAIMRDLTMLENQVPLFLLQKLLEMELDSRERAEETLCDLVRLACVELSPFIFEMLDISRMRVKESSHLLEALYNSLVPAAAMDDIIPKGDEDDEVQPSSPDKKNVSQAFKSLWKSVSSLKLGPIRRILTLPERVLKGRFVQFVMNMPLHILSALGNLPVLRLFKGPFIFLFGSSTNNKADKDEEGGSSVETPPTRDELTVPCVADLYSAGVKFVPTQGDLATIRFDQLSATLYLPKVKLDGNTEVVLRNLVAFEASAAPGEFIFTRYTDFMNGIIDTEEDVRLLRNCGIVFNRLQSDGKVASMWNGMGKCVPLTKVKYLDQVIADLNNYYCRTWSVAMVEYVKKYIFGSWKFLSLLAALILLLLTCLQAFCSVYDCKKWFNNTNLLQG